jgi:hypothetical protein
MTGIPWDGYSGGNIGRIDIHFLNGTTVIYARTINLTGYTTWTNWLTIAINKGNITTIKFDAPGIPPWNNGFWPAIDDLEINNGLSTVVDEFEAYPLNRSSLIEWSTNQESVLLGFELYRSESIEGPFDMVGDLITSHFGSPEGFNYSYKDENLRNKKEYWYQLKVIYSSGEPEYIDPVSVIPGLKKDRINESSSY